MRCIFCKLLTTTNEPIEHILPESLGNTRHVLKRGLVCGGCNNYFASKVEKPFLELDGIKTLRFEQLVPSKKGRVPSVRGSMGRAAIEAGRDPESGVMSVKIPDRHWSDVARHTPNIILPRSVLLTPSAVVSRFVAKVAIEALAQRLETNSEKIAELVDHEHLNAIRQHARFGARFDWPVSIRKIYDASAKWSDPKNGSYQIVHEFDFLFAAQGELYFALAIFGQEFVMNMGGPSLEGWDTWLGENDQRSPLHCGKNAGVNTRESGRFEASTPLRDILFFTD